MHDTMLVRYCAIQSVQRHTTAPAEDGLFRQLLNSRVTVAYSLIMPKNGTLSAIIEH